MPLPIADRCCDSQASEGRTAIVYGFLWPDGQTDWPGRNMLLHALADHAPVVMLQRATARHFDRPHLQQLGKNLYLTNNAFALRSHRLGRRIAGSVATMDGRWFRVAMRAAGFTDYVMWLTVPDPVLALDVPADRLVYDCMDPNFLPELQAQHDRVEFELARRASVVFASAQTLLERMRSVNANTYLLPNAAPARALHLGWQGTPAPLADRVRPVVGYLGTMDWRFDASYVLAAATALSGVTFALVGRVNSDQEDKIAPLRSLPNVVLPGQVSNSEASAYVSSFDVGIIPFAPTPTNDAINPVKMYLYLAAGLPVVSTSIAECRANPFVATARDPVEFAHLVEHALKDRGDVAGRIAYAAANTWTQRAAVALDVLSAHGLAP